jgi:hypothetical protein
MSAEFSATTLLKIIGEVIYRMIELTRLKAVPCTAMHLAELPIEFSEVRGKLGLAPMGLTLGAECKRSDSLGGKTHHTPFYSPTIYKAGNLVDFPLWHKKL